MRPLKIGQHTAPIPIIQGGMGVGISLSGLASAVANEGGIGVIAAAGIGMNEPDFYTGYLEANVRALRREIRKAKRLTSGIVGLNVMVALSYFDQVVRVAVEEEVDIVFSGAGLPLNLPEFLPRGGRTAAVPIVSSGRAAALICKRWLHKYDCLPDAVVVEGPKAGGHIGFSKEQIFDEAYALDRLVPAVIEAVGEYAVRYGKSIPVIAAGGIYTGEDIFEFLRIGAAGVQMGTRFVATDECDAAPAFKQAYVGAGPEDLIIIDSPVGMPGRAIRNAYLDAVEAGAKTPFRCPYHCITSCDFKNSPYCIAHALISAQRGRFKGGFAFAGANAYRVTEIVPVRELIASLRAEYGEAVSRVSAAV